MGKGLDDPEKVIVFLKMEDPDKAKELTASQGMKDRMKEAGITGTPTFTYLETVMDDNSTIANKPADNNHKVKDWDAWKKEFDNHKQVGWMPVLSTGELGIPLMINSRPCCFCCY